MAVTPARAATRTRVQHARPILRFPLMAAIAAVLAAGIAGGLARAGMVLPATASWIGEAALAHAALMICGFLGTMIGLERAVAVKHRAAFAAPALSLAGALGLIAGWPQAGAWLLAAASAAFVLVNVEIVKRQRAAHTMLLLAAAACWLAGNLLFAGGLPAGAIVPWWFAFLIITIAAERLEMTRLARRAPSAQRMLVAVLCAMAAGAALGAAPLPWGGVLYGASLVLLAVWLGVFDIARRTVRAHGLSRYMAVCLLAGYVWLAVAGLAWAATALGVPARDTALHALGLGFVFSMMMGHAPVILPAVAGVKVQFGWPFYVPLAVLHLSLVLRLAGGAHSAWLRSAGTGCNVLAIVLFAATMVGAAIAWRQRTPSRR